MRVGNHWWCNGAAQSNEIPENASPEARELIRRLDDGLNLMIDRYERLTGMYNGLQAEHAEATGKLEVVSKGAVGVLREIAHNQSLDPNLRCRAATALAPFETPKLSAVITTAAKFNLFDHLEKTQVIDLEARRAKVIEQAPGPDAA
jgi:hypothetical protein